jgi:hypothetical protein
MRARTEVFGLTKPFKKQKNQRYSKNQSTQIELKNARLKAERDNINPEATLLIINTTPREPINSVPA